MLCLFNCVVESKDRVRVGGIHYKPMTHLTEEQRDRGIMVDATEEDVPQPEMLKGKQAILYFNPSTKQFWHEYVERPLTQEELLADVVERLDAVITLLESRIA